VVDQDYVSEYCHARFRQSAEERSGLPYSGGGFYEMLLDSESTDGIASSSLGDSKDVLAVELLERFRLLLTRTLAIVAFATICPLNPSDGTADRSRTCYLDGR
jgi:hypothetical protein